MVAVYPKILTSLHINIFSLPCLLQLQNSDETQRMNHHSEPEESKVEFLFFLGMDNSYLAMEVRIDASFIEFFLKQKRRLCDR